MSSTTGNRTTDSDDRVKYVGMRTTPEFKQKVEIRAAEEGMNVTEYLKSLLEEDIEENLYSKDF